MNKIRFILIAISVLFAKFNANGQKIESKVLLAFETKDYVIRIDSLIFDDTGNTYRYCSWKKNKSMQSLPDIEIMGNEYDYQKNCYIFVIGDVVEGEYNYMVYDNIKKGFNGIIVTRNGKVILKQARIR